MYLLTVETWSTETNGILITRGSGIAWIIANEIGFLFP